MRISFLPISLKNLDPGLFCCFVKATYCTCCSFRMICKMTVTVRLLLTFTAVMALMHVAAGISCYSCSYYDDPSDINCAPPFNSAGILIVNGTNGETYNYCDTTKVEYGGMYMYLYMYFLHDTNCLICR